MEVFKNTELNYGGGFATNRGVVTSVGGRLDGTLMQNIGITYGQQTNRIYELGRAGQTRSFYVISGQANGTLNVGHILGPPIQLFDYYQDFSDVCNAAQNNVRVELSEATCGNFGGFVGRAQQRAVTAKFCVLAQITMGAGSNDLLITESSQIMFGNMDYLGP